MSNKELLQESFELAAPYISHLTEMRDLVERTIQETKTVCEAIEFLMNKKETVDMTFSTDIRILINKLRNVENRKPSP